jgi:23S rRNA (guanosine2251-2'-O)-methyltransferase
MNSNFRPRRSPRPEFEDLAFGLHAVYELLQAGKEINRILIAREGKTDALRELLAIAKQRQVPVQEVPKEKLNSLTRKNHQGVIAFVSPIEYQELEQLLPTLFEQGKTPLLLVLDRITDVRNLGAIARSAQCAGVDAIVIPLRDAAQVTADAIKTSAGALASLPVCRERSLDRVIDYLLDSGIQLVAATEHAADDYYAVDFSLPTAIIMGSEEDGIHPNILRKASVLARIPIVGTVGSLNVSVAAGVLLFESVRQRIQSA